MLAHVLSKLNRQRGYGLHLFLLSIDEGIAGYRDDSLETVKRNERQVMVCTCVQATGLAVGYAEVCRVVSHGPTHAVSWKLHRPAYGFSIECRLWE